MYYVIAHYHERCAQGRTAVAVDRLVRNLRPLSRDWACSGGKLGGHSDVSKGRLAMARDQMPAERDARPGELRAGTMYS